MARQFSLCLMVLGSWFLTNAVRGDEPAPKTVAHIRLAGALDEAPLPADPLFGAATENFQSKLDRIRKAQKDEKVHGLLLQIDELQIGWGKLDELSRALTDFRAAGKKTFAFLESGNTKDYLLALACDEVAVPEPGWIMLTGLRSEVTFFKELFDKVGVKADMLQMGDFKAAAEPFTRSNMSEPAKRQLTAVLDDYFDKSIVERIVKARAKQRFTAEHVKKLIDRGPFSARGALEAGLIDQVAYSDVYQDKIKLALKSGDLKVAKNYAQAKMEDIDFSNPFAFFKLFATTKSGGSLRPKVAIIHAVGAITAGRSTESFMGEESCGARTIIEAVRQAESDKTVKAIVLRVDSPGGSALGSDLMWNELKRCKKPVIASMSDVAASGGYYISMAARKIYAEPGTLTGSIGVVGGKLAIGGVYDKIGLKTEVIQRGANAGIFSSMSGFSPSEKASMLVLMKDTYEQFLIKVLEGRKVAGKPMDRAKLETLAGGRIWTGRQALANGLIDELGTLQDAVAASWKMASMPADREPEILNLPKPRSFLDSLIEGKLDTRVSAGAELRLLRMLPELTQPIGLAASLWQLRGEPVWLIAPYRLEVR